MTSLVALINYTSRGRFAVDADLAAGGCPSPVGRPGRAAGGARGENHFSSYSTSGIVHFCACLLRLAPFSLGTRIDK